MPDCSDTSSLPWRRHDLLRVAPDIWASVLVHCPSLANLPLVASWADRGWPVILRRRAEADDPALLPVGLPLPPAAGKRRIALLLPPEGVLQRSSPPLLRAAGRVADPGWRSTIASLLALGARTGVEPSAFGSLLWQHQTGLTYLSPHSDLDVLWPVPPGVDVLSLFFGIAEVQRQAPLRIDGEVDPSAVGRKNGPFPRVSLVAPRRRRSLDRTSSGHSAREPGTGAVDPPAVIAARAGGKNGAFKTALMPLQTGLLYQNRGFWERSRHRLSTCRNVPRGRSNGKFHPPDANKFHRANVR